VSLRRAPGVGIREVTSDRVDGLLSVLVGGDGYLPVLARVAVVPLRVSKPEVSASGGPVGVFFGRLFPTRRAFAISLWFK
jgi:hypothetical protein